MKADRSYVKRGLGLAALVVLGSLIVARGVVPALTATSSDFGNYLTAAKVVADGGPAARLYDDAWFERQMRRYGTWNGIPGKFTPFPPPTALLLVPLARLAPLDALRVMTALSVLALLASIALLRRALSWSWLCAALLVLASGFAIMNGFRFGQPYMLISLACIAGYVARASGRPALAGACFGVFVPFKYFPAVFLAYFAWRREWRLVLAGVLTVTVIVLAGVSILGVEVHAQYLRTVLIDHLAGKISMQDPYTASFQSFDSLFRRWFVPDPVANPHPWVAAPAARLLLLAGVKAAILVGALAGLGRLSRRKDAGVAPSIGLLGLTIFVLAPATATYHCVLLWLPVGLLAAHFARQRQGLASGLILAAFAVLGYFPHGWLNRFEGRGALTVLAYPRLLLLLFMFVTSLCYLWPEPPRPAGSNEPVPARP